MLSDVKGLFICGNYHMDKNQQPRDEIRREIEKVDWEGPDVIFAISDLTALHEMSEDLNPVEDQKPEKILNSTYEV